MAASRTGQTVAVMRAVLEPPAPATELVPPVQTDRRHHRLPAVALATVPAIRTENAEMTSRPMSLPATVLAIIQRAQEGPGPREDRRMVTTPVFRGDGATEIPPRVVPMPRYKNVPGPLKSTNSGS